MTVLFLPLASGDSPLQYRLADGGYLLFSVGIDGVDDGGQTVNQDGYRDPFHGDLRLESFFADMH